MAELSPFISSTWPVLHALLKMCLAGWGAALSFPESLRDSGVKGSCLLHGFIIHFFSLPPPSSPFTVFGLCFFLYLFKSAWVNREQEGGDWGHW